MHGAVLRRPGVDLAAAALREPHQAFEQLAPQQAEHRLRAQLAILLGRAGHRDLGVLRLRGFGQARHEVGREQRRVARDGDDPLRAGLLQAGEEAGERPREVGQGVRPHGDAERFVGGQVAVGVDQHLADLRLQPQQGVHRQRHAVEVLQALVDPAHAGAAAAGQDEAGDVVIQPPDGPPLGG
jgi:hypothetical protein